MVSLALAFLSFCFSSPLSLPVLICVYAKLYLRSGVKKKKSHTHTLTFSFFFFNCSTSQREQKASGRVLNLCSQARVLSETVAQPI